MDWQEPVPLKNLLLFPHRVLRMVHYLRASSDHRFIVGALRARRMVWLFPSHPSKLARSLY